MKNKKIRRHSIRKQFATTTIILIASTILICLIVNVIFLEDIYKKNKMNNLVDTYELLNANCNREDLFQEEVMISLDKACGRHNLNMLILDERNYPLLYSTMNLESLSTKLIRYRLGYQPTKAIIKETEKYIIQRTEDSRTNTENMEMWGILDNGFTFLFTTPIESISESAKISNSFLTLIGFIAIIAGGIVAWVYSGKISTPILHLAELSNKMTQLDFDAKYDGKERNEIAVLGKNMNILSKSLKNTISELKTANVELQKDIKKKEEMDLQRQEFIGNISHELKTPIALIQGYAEGLKEGIAEDKESMDYYLEVICDEAQRMNRMVKNLMTLNELESGLPVVTMEVFDIVSLVENYIANTKVLTKERNVKISLHGPGKLLVWGDEFKVEEVVMNYITNAFHHVSVDGEIVINISNYVNCARISVYNTGEKIPEEDIPHIWDKFYKVDKARTRAYGGSGVGLSIVKAIMNSMHQPYGVENKEQGVEFWFELSLLETDMIKEPNE